MSTWFVDDSRELSDGNYIGQRMGENEDSGIQQTPH